MQGPSSGRKKHTVHDIFLNRHFSFLFLRIFGGTLKPQKDILVAQRHCTDRTDTWELDPVSKKMPDVYLIKSMSCGRYISTKRVKPIDEKMGMYQAVLDPRLSLMSIERGIKLCLVPGIQPPPEVPLPPTPPIIFSKKKPSQIVL